MIGKIRDPFFGYSGYTTEPRAWFALWKRTPQKWVLSSWIFGPESEVLGVAQTMHLCKAFTVGALAKDKYVITSGDGSNRIVGGMQSW